MPRRVVFLSAAAVGVLVLLWIALRPHGSIASGRNAVSEPGVGRVDGLGFSSPTETTGSQPAGLSEDDASREIDGILRSDLPDARKAEMLLARIPGLPASAKSEAMRHALNLIPDAQFASVRPWLTASAPRLLGAQVLSEIANRPDPLKLRLLLEILDTPGHPLHAEARLMLIPYVGIPRVDSPTDRRRAVEERLSQATP